MRTDEEEEASKSLNVISVTVFVLFVRFCPPYFLSVLKIQGTERTDED